MNDEVFARVTQGAQEAVEIHHLRAELEASETELRIVRASQAESNAEVERLRAELAEAQEKALRCDLDMAGIERREQEATELVQLRAECLRLHHAEAEAMAVVLSQEEQIERMRKDAIDHTGLRVACQYLLQAYEAGSDLQTSIDRVERALAAKEE